MDSISSVSPITYPYAAPAMAAQLGGAAITLERSVLKQQDELMTTLLSGMSMLGRVLDVRV